MGLIAIWDAGTDGLADATDMAVLADCGGVWQTDVERLGPWRRERVRGFDTPLWLATGQAPVPLLLLTARCSSCLDVAWHLHETGILPLFSAVLAGSQWAGRGQFGRRWISPPGNVYGTWLLPSEAAGEPTLSLTMGYAVVWALKELGVSAQLKWPNDVLVAGRKVAGILCEQRGETVAAGIGINVLSCPGPHELRDDHAFPATALAEHGVETSPLALWLGVLHAGRDLLAVPERRCQLMKELEPYLAYRDQSVWVRPLSGKPFPARVKGLDPKGALWVERTDGDIQRVLSASLAVAEGTDEWETTS